MTEPEPPADPSWADLTPTGASAPEATPYAEDPPYTNAVPPEWMEPITPEELAALGTEENPWPPPPEGWVTP